jgi:hypothetical protein
MIAGVVATATFETIEIGYYHTLANLNRSTVLQLLNSASAPVAGAVIGGLVGRAVWFVGWLIGWPAKRQDQPVASAVALEPTSIEALQSPPDAWSRQATVPASRRFSLGAVMVLVGAIARPGCLHAQH